MMALILFGTASTAQDLNKLVDHPEGANEITINTAGYPICSFEGDGVYEFNFEITTPLTNHYNIEATDLHLNEIVSGDTLSVVTSSNGTYYGTTNSVIKPNGTTVTTNYPVNSLTTDGDNVYALWMSPSGYSFNIIKFTSTGEVPTGTNFGNGVSLYDSPVDNYTDMDYFTLGGIEYISFVGGDGFSNNHLTIYNLNNGEYYRGTQFGCSGWLNDITSVTFFDSELYVSRTDNRIYKVSSINGPTSGSTGIECINVNVNITHEYYVGTSIGDIREFEFYQDGGGFNYVYVAFSDGLYSNITSVTNTFNLSVDNQGEAISSALYPNPNNGTFTISNVEEGTATQIINRAGQIVYETKDFGNLDLNIEVPAGIYFVRLMNNSSSKTIKFVKQ